jgi:AraC family transcriptional activator of pobA
MSEELQSILLEDLKITLPGIVLRRIALNRHMPRVEKLSEHVHEFQQILLYLRGEGEQYFDGFVVRVSRGTVLSIPPGRPHRFVKSKAASPICLAIDLEIGEVNDWPDRGVLNRNQLATIESRLFDLNALQKKKEPSLVAIASRILRILGEIEEALRDENAASLSGPVYRRVMRVVERHNFAELSPKLISNELGRSLDHLNRQLGDEVGMTVGQVLNKVRMERCAKLLRETDASIGEIGSVIGFDDQNYFARWFRKQTGQSPTRWRQSVPNSK